MPIARIKLISRIDNAANKVANAIIELAKANNVKYRGPIPLPTKHLRVATRKAVGSQGSHTWAHYEMRVHRLLVDIEGNDQTLRQLMHITVPEGVLIEIALLD